MTQSPDNLYEQLSNRIEEGRVIVDSEIKNDDDLRSAVSTFLEWDGYNYKLLASALSTEHMAAEYRARAPTTLSTAALPLPVRLARFREQVEGRIASLTSIQGQLSVLDVPAELSSSSARLEILRSHLQRFHSVVRQLSVRRENRPTLIVNDEYDVQDLLRSLLVLTFNDVRPEEWNPSYAGKSSRVDFFLPEEETAIEVKKPRRGQSEKDIGDELIIDIERYQRRPDCTRLICFIYDPDLFIGNPVGFVGEISRRTDSFSVEVVISPPPAP
jgi:hypothetical protein